MCLKCASNADESRLKPRILPTESYVVPQNGGLISIDPYAPPKERYIPQKEPHILPKEPYIRSAKRECLPGVREKRGLILIQTYVLREKKLYSAKRALNFAKRECLPEVQVNGGRILHPR